VRHRHSRWSLLFLLALSGWCHLSLAAQESDQMAIIWQIYSAIAKEAHTSLIQVRIGVFNGRSGIRVTISDTTRLAGDSVSLEPLAHRLAALAWAALANKEPYEFLAVGWAATSGPIARAYRYFEYQPNALDSLPPAVPDAPAPRLQPSNYRMKRDGLGRRFSQGWSTRPSSRSLARTRLGPQLMRGR
jgi:hypothetical protein